MTSPRPRWIEDVPDLYDNIADLTGYFTLPQACDYTGLSVNTLQDLLSRPRITANENTLAPVSRPAARVGNSPYYSQDQLDDVCDRQLRPVRRHLGGGDEPLPVLTADEANERGLVSYEEMGDLFGRHPNTFRKWWSTIAEFPSPVATRERRGGHPGTPTVVFDSRAVLRWLFDNRKIRGNTVMVHGREVSLVE